MNITKKLTRGVNMNKKIGVSILLGVLVLIGVVFVAKFSSGTYLDTANTKIEMYSAAGGDIDWFNTTRGGYIETANVTIRYTGDGSDNITAINISWAGNYTVSAWAYYLQDIDNSYSDGNFTSPENDVYGNVTFLSNGEVADWNCTTTNSSTIGCYNNSMTAALGPNNNTLIIRFNVTAIGNAEDREAWNISVFTGDPITGSVIDQVTTLYTYVDGLAPRLINLSVQIKLILFN